MTYSYDKMPIAPNFTSNFFSDFDENKFNSITHHFKILKINFVYAYELKFEKIDFFSEKFKDFRQI